MALPFENSLKLSACDGEEIRLKIFARVALYC